MHEYLRQRKRLLYTALTEWENVEPGAYFIIVLPGKPLPILPSKLSLVDDSLHLVKSVKMFWVKGVFKRHQ